MPEKKKSKAKPKSHSTVSRSKKNAKPKKAMATERERHENKDPSNGGRPTDYDFKIAQEICEQVATTSFGLRKLCELNPHWPSRDTIYRWRYRYDEFSDLYNRAKLKQADYMAEELLEIADNANNDWMESLGDDGQAIGYKLNGEHVNRSRLRIDTRKWLASKLLPKAYGNMVGEAAGEGLSLVEQALTELAEKRKKNG